MTTLQKKAYRYEVLSEIDDYAKNFLEKVRDQANYYAQKDAEKKKEWENDNPGREYTETYWKNEADSYAEKISVIEALRKEIEKL